MEKVNKIIFGDFGIVFFLHLALILIFYFSPFIFSWKIIIFFLLYICFQEVFFQGCLLSFFQFGRERRKLPFFHFYYLGKMGINLNKKSFNFILVWLVPTGIFIFSLVWQEVFSQKPLF